MIIGLKYLIYLLRIKMIFFYDPSKLSEFVWSMDATFFGMSRF